MAKVRGQKTYTGEFGTEITPEVADELAAEAERGYDLSTAMRQAVSRSSLRVGGTSPPMSFRVSPDTFQAARRRAEEEGRSISELARDAVERYIRS